MRGMPAVYLREMLLLRRRAKRLVAGMAVSPALYLLTFGLALGGDMRVGGRAYIEFLLPGLVAMAGMTQAFAMAGEVNIARFYSGIFEEIQSAPVSGRAYALGTVCAGVTRAALAAGVNAGLGLAFGVEFHCGGWFWLGVILNGFAFSALAVALAMLVRSHADQAALTSFVVTPMAFLGGTFFPLEALPRWAGAALSVLPLSHGAAAIRAAAFGQPPVAAPYCALAGAAAVFFLFAVWAVGRARD